jgi:hypothetical protein
MQIQSLHASIDEIYWNMTVETRRVLFLSVIYSQLIKNKSSVLASSMIYLCTGEDIRITEKYKRSSRTRKAFYERPFQVME